MAGYDFSELTILFVDDDMLMRNLVKTMLSSLGIKKQRIVSSVQRARDELRASPPDILLVDWEMQPEDGFSFAREVRNTKDNYLSHMPIIMLTGYTQLDRVYMARDAGINEFLAKPVSAERLYKRILSVVKKPRKFVRTKTYFGPDRRRKQRAFNGPDRRKMPSAEEA